MQILPSVEDKRAGENSKGELYLCISRVLITCNIPDMPAIAVAVFFDTDDGQSNQS